MILKHYKHWTGESEREKGRLTERERERERAREGERAWEGGQ